MMFGTGLQGWVTAKVKHPGIQTQAFRCCELAESRSSSDGLMDLGLGCNCDLLRRVVASIGVNKQGDRSEAGVRSDLPCAAIDDRHHNVFIIMNSTRLFD